VKELARQLAFVLLFLPANGLSRAAAESSLPPDYSIPVIDLSKNANRQVIVDKEPGPAAYSRLAVPPDSNIACLYEAGKNHPYKTIAFARFTVDWPTGGKENARDLRKTSGIMPNKMK
jgi:hypothetical protein